MNLIYYLLESNFYFIIFYGFYKMFLQKETFYTLNRYFLISSTLIAFTIPFFQLGILQANDVESQFQINNQIGRDTHELAIEKIILMAYLVPALFFLTKLAWGFRNVFQLLRKSNRKSENGIIIIALDNTKSAFSFFNLLFIDPALPQKNTIINHEMAHIKQLHSIDILFFELMKSLNWFNPFFYMLRNDIKLVHEYLADEETTMNGIEKYEYAMFLIQHSYGDKMTQLTNQIFNSSILKKRINMLNQKKSAKWARLRLLLVLPLTSVLLCASTMAFTKNYGVVDLYPKRNSVITANLQDTTKKKKIVKTRLLPIPPAVGPKVKGIQQAPPPPPLPPAASKLSPKLPNSPPLPPPPPVAPKEKANKSVSKITTIKGVKTSDKPEKLSIVIAEPLPLKANSAKKDMVDVEVLPKN